MSRRFWVYLLASQRNGTLYIGVTNDLPRRIAEHKTRKVAGFTRQYNIAKLVWFEEYESILDARAQETRMKRWHRAWKLDLIEKNNPDWNDLSLDHII